MKRTGVKMTQYFNHSPAPSKWSLVLKSEVEAEQPSPAAVAEAAEEDPDLLGVRLSRYCTYRELGPLNILGGMDRRWGFCPLSIEPRVLEEVAGAPAPPVWRLLWASGGTFPPPRSTFSLLPVWKKFKYVNYCYKA